ncbi:MAG TPA: hypothetical protein EYG08_05495, partial [Myxococcales bacterium]|nr:hypothetical protein [Myxococcales bacterium]
MPDMNGAQALIRPLVDCGVDTCFANPGTSEMYFVAAGVEKHIVQRVVSSPMDPIYDQARELVNLLVFDTED